MKYLFFMVLALFIWTSCESTEKPVRPEQPFEKELPLIVEGEDGKYTEWYPGRRQIKITGRKDNDGNRTGIWKYFSDQGVELSITVYTAGKKDGHTVVRYPSGMTHYVGEYENDEPVGEWKFYNEEGEVTEVKDYSKED